MNKKPTDAYNQAAANKLLATAKQMAGDGASWTQVNNALFGLGSEFATAFPTKESRQAFHDGPENLAIREIMSGLPMPHEHLPTADSASGKFLVRLPRSLHEGLIAEAEAEGVSLNQLVVAKLAMGLGQAVAGSRETTRPKSKGKKKGAA